MDYAFLRRQMVEEQLLRRGIRDNRVLAAFYKVPRHKFVSLDIIDNAYADFPLPIGYGQTISQPYIVALMIELLNLTGSERVLEVGTGSGYQTALLAELAGEVYTVERLSSLANKAELLLKELGYTVKLKTGDGALGWPEAAPFDSIIVSASAYFVPQPLIEQLRDGGKMILPLGNSFSQVLTLAEKVGGQIKYKDICGCAFVPLISEV